MGLTQWPSSGKRASPILPARMPTDFPALLEKFQANAYDGMVTHLADHLGLQADPLRRLGIGFAPIVQFSRGPSYEGWWVFPERDINGKPTGFNLRNSRDKKASYPGTKHGLFYEVNPQHQHGEHGYSAGPNNWVRTMSVGLDCPICGKPDGCLLSSENPADPKAVVCIRIQEGSQRPLRFGFLHIRKAEGQLASGSALANHGGPVLVVEGATDTAAAMQLGFDGVGRFSNVGGADLVADLVRGRDIIVVGENDRKPDGSEPGREGMLAAFQTIKTACKNVQWVMPPDHLKDLRAWLVRGGLTHDSFLEYVDKHGQKRQDEGIINDERPTTIAVAYLDSRYRLGNRYSLKRWRESWYQWKHGCYQGIPDEAAIQPIIIWSKDKRVQRELANGDIKLVKLAMGQNTRRNVQEAILAETLVHEPSVPCWINGATGPDPKDLIVFSNGVLNVPAYLAGASDCLGELTPDLFTTSALATAFDPTAVCGTWLEFLESSLGDEPAKIDLLQEWFGYCMTPDISMQKMMFMRGPTAAGKGVILNTLCKLVGADQATATSLRALSKEFGLHPLVGKLVAVIPDARTPNSWDGMAGLEALLNIAGADNVSVNRKFKDHLGLQRLTARISIGSNEFLDLPDYVGAMIRRLCIIQFEKSFKDNPDTSMEVKLSKEVAGIAIWALQGLRRLRECGIFTEPASSIKAREEWRTATSPIAAFIEECCDIETEQEVGKTELYDAWDGWRGERRLPAMPKGRFFERLRANSPTVHSVTEEEGVHKNSVFRGISLKRWAARQYTGRPQ